jgi:hypothetical protein
MLSLPPEYSISYENNGSAPGSFDFFLALFPLLLFFGNLIGQRPPSGRGLPPVHTKKIDLTPASSHGRHTATFYFSGQRAIPRG